MIVRIPPVQQNWKKKLMKLTCLVEMQFYDWFGELSNHAGTHRTRCFETGERSSEEAAVFASMNSTCKIAKQVHNQPVWSDLAEQIFTPARM